MIEGLAARSERSVLKGNVFRCGGSPHRHRGTPNDPFLIGIKANQFGVWEQSKARLPCAFSFSSALAWISTEGNSPHTMSLESTIFRAFRSETAVICYARWCADSLVARR